MAKTKQNVDGLYAAGSSKTKESRKIVLEYIGEDASEKKPIETPAAGTRLDALAKNKKQRPAVSAADRQAAAAAIELVGKEAAGDRRAAVFSDKKEEAEKPALKSARAAEQPAPAALPAIRKRPGPKTGRPQPVEPAAEAGVTKRSARPKTHRLISARKIKRKTLAVKNRVEKNIARAVRPESPAGRSSALIGKFFSIAAAVVFAYYLLFALSVYWLHPDNRYSRLLNRCLPVPAIVSNFGFLDYYEYNDGVAAALAGGAPSLGEARQEMARLIIAKKIAREHGLELGAGRLSPEKKSELDAILLEAGLSRGFGEKAVEARKSIDSGENFDDAAKRYGFDLNSRYFTAEEAAGKFGGKIALMQIGQVSDIIVGEDGYFVVQVLEKNDAAFGLKYFYARGKILDDYIDEYLKRMKLWSLVR